MNPPSFFRAISVLMARRRVIRAHIRTERMLGSLPFDIRKDIGWPDAWTGPDRDR